VTVGDPFRRAAWWVFVCPLFRCEAIADDSAAGDVAQIINPLGIGAARSYSAS